MRRRRFGAALAAAVIGLAAGPGAAQAATVVLGTATPGGGFPVYGDAVAQAVGEADAGLRVETRNTRGSTENVVLLRESRLDLGLVTGEVAHEAVAGGAVPALSMVAAMYSSPGMFVVRADHPARTIADLRGQAAVFEARGSGLVVLARAVLGGMGLDVDRDLRAV